MFCHSHQPSAEVAQTSSVCWINTFFRRHWYIYNARSAAVAAMGTKPFGCAPVNWQRTDVNVGVKGPGAIHTLTWVPVRQKGDSSTDRGLRLKVGIRWGSSSIVGPLYVTRDGLWFPECLFLHWGGKHVISYSTISFLLSVTWTALIALILAAVMDPCLR